MQASQTLAVSHSKSRVVRTYAKENLKLAEKFDRWLEYRHLSPNTRRAYRTTVTAFCRMLASRSVADAHRFDFTEYSRSLFERGMSRSSMARHTATIKTFFKFLNLGHVVASDPARRLPSPKVGVRLP